jgi:hypothetical protein
MLVAVLIGIMIAIVVGVSLIPTIVGTISSVSDNLTNFPAVGAMLGVLPIVFMAVILLAAVAWLGSSQS